MAGVVTWLRRDYLASLQRYATFSGRSDREELWAFGLVTVAVGLLAMCGDQLAGLTDPASFGFYRVVQIVHALPFMALGARRFHDLDRSAWYMLAPPAWRLALWERGLSEPNRFGPPPEGELASPLPVPPKAPRGDRD